MAHKRKGMGRTMMKGKIRMLNDEEKLGKKTKGKKTMLSNKETIKWLKENRMNEDGDLDLQGLDLSKDFNHVLICQLTVKGNLFQNRQKVGGMLYQGFQKVSDSLGQNCQKVGGTLYQDCQTVTGDLFQDDQKITGDLYQDHQTVAGDLFQDDQKFKGRIINSPEWEDDI